MTSWVLSTNPDDYRSVCAETVNGPCILGWTVARDVRRGDLVALYGHGSNKTFGFLGIVLTEPVESVNDRNRWSWIEFVAASPVSLARAKKHDRIGHWPSFRYMHWTARKMDNALWIELASLMLRNAPDAVTRMREWPKAFAREPDLPSLRYAYREYDNTDGSGTIAERELQRRIRAVWIDEGRGREIDPALDGVVIPPSLKLGSAGFADIILVDLDSPRSLQVIEVKRAAKPGPRTDGVTQLSGAYVPWLERRLPGWEIKPILIALNMSPTVREQAARHGIELWEFGPDWDEFDNRDTQ